MPTRKHLRHCLAYDPDSGLFTWRNRPERSASWNARWAGKTAGGLRPDGYIDVKVDGQKYRGGRVAWLLAGRALRWADEIDHINGNPGDNRLSNLRCANRSENMANKRKSTEKSLPKGVYAVGSKYQVIIQVRCKRINLGRFAELAAAKCAYATAATKFFGEFARDA